MIDSRPLEEPYEVIHSQKAARHKHLKWLMLGISLLMAVLVVVEHLLAPYGDSRAVIAGVMGLIAFMAYLLIKTNRAQVMNVPLVVSMLLLGGWAMYGFGSVRANSSLAMVAAVVMAGAFLNRNYVILTTLGALLILGGLTWAENAGWLPTPVFEVGVRFWSLGSVIFLVIGALLYYTQGATGEAHLRRLNQVEDRSRLEQERDQYLRRFQRVFQLNPTALMIQSTNSKIILDANPAFERRFGYPLAELVGRHTDFLWANVLEWQAHRDASLVDGQGKWLKTQGLGADGDCFDVWVSCVLSEGQSGSLVLTTVVDPQPSQP